MRVDFNDDFMSPIYNVLLLLVYLNYIPDIFISILV